MISLMLNHLVQSDCFHVNINLNLNLHVKWESQTLLTKLFLQLFVTLIFFDLGSSCFNHITQIDSLAHGDHLNEKLIDLLQQDVRVNEPDFNNDQKTALHVASHNICIKINHLLWDKGARIDALVDYGNALPMDACCLSGKPEIGNLLIDKGAFIDQTCCLSGKPEIVNLLIDKGAFIDQMSNSGQTSIILALANRNNVVVNLPIERSANVNLNIDGAFLISACSSHHPDFEFI